MEVAEQAVVVAAMARTEAATVAVTMAAEKVAEKVVAKVVAQVVVMAVVVMAVVAMPVGSEVQEMEDMEWVEALMAAVGLAEVALAAERAAVGWAQAAA